MENVQYKKSGMVVYKGVERGTAVGWRVGAQGAAMASAIMYSSEKCKANKVKRYKAVA